MKWRARVSLATWRSRCWVCGARITGTPGDVLPIIDHGDGSGSPLCDDCARRDDPAGFDVVVCERIAALPVADPGPRVREGGR